MFVKYPTNTWNVSRDNTNKFANILKIEKFLQRFAYTYMVTRYITNTYVNRKLKVELPNCKSRPISTRVSLTTNIFQFSYKVSI